MSDWRSLASARAYYGRALGWEERSEATFACGETALFLREAGEGAVVVWQGVTTDPRAGTQIFRQALGRDAQLSGARREVSGRKASERIRGAAARGDDLLLAWERHIVGVASSMSATIVRETTESEARPATLSFAAPKSLALPAQRRRREEAVKR